jgi:lipopolysaccharide export system permease protein
MIENKIPLILQSITTILPFILLNRYFQSFSLLSIIWFTSKLANNTEIIAILGSGISFTRFFKTLYNRCFYHISFVLLMGFYVVPVSVKCLIILDILI